MESRKSYRLENWSLVYLDPYSPTELQHPHLNGEVYGHPRFPDGDKITTTRILNVNGNLVETRNSLYELGVADEKYVQWCKDNKLHVPTPECPIIWKN